MQIVIGKAKNQEKSILGIWIVPLNPPIFLEPHQSVLLGLIPNCSLKVSLQELKRKNVTLVTSRLTPSPHSLPQKTQNTWKISRIAKIGEKLRGLDLD